MVDIIIIIDIQTKIYLQDEHSSASSNLQHVSNSDGRINLRLDALLVNVSPVRALEIVNIKTTGIATFPLRPVLQHSVVPGRGRMVHLDVAVRQPTEHVKRFGVQGNCFHDAASFKNLKFVTQLKFTY